MQQSGKVAEGIREAKTSKANAFNEGAQSVHASDLVRDLLKSRCEKSSSPDSRVFTRGSLW